MIVVDLYAGEIGNAVFSLCKNSVTVGAMYAVQYFPFFRTLNQCRTCLLPHMIGNVVFHRLLRRAVAKREGGEEK